MVCAGKKKRNATKRNSGEDSRYLYLSKYEIGWRVCCNIVNPEPLSKESRERGDFEAVECILTWWVGIILFSSFDSTSFPGEVLPLAFFSFLLLRSLS